MKKLRFFVILRLTMIFVLIYEQADALAQECRKAVFVYLDVSGSMYLTGAPYGDKNLATYDGRQRRLMDAMTFMISDIFSIIEPTPILYEEDRFELIGFYDDINYLINPINDFKSADYKILRGLHKDLDKDKNSQLNAADFERLFPEQNATNFIPMVEDFSRKLEDVKFSRIKYKSIVFLIFTDGDHERSFGELNRLLTEFKNTHSRLLRDKTVKFIFFESSRSNVSETFRKQLDASVKRFSEVKNMSEELVVVKQSIEHAIGDFILFTSVSPEEAFLNLKSKQKKLDFVFEGVNQSCVEEKLSKIDLSIREENDNLASPKLIPIAPESFPPSALFKRPISILLDIDKPGTYELILTPITENRDPIPENQVKVKLTVVQSAINPASLLVGALLLLFVIIVFVFIRLKTRA